MTLIIVLLCIAALVVMISVFKVSAFLSFLVISVAAGLMLGIPPAQISHSVEKGIGDTLGSLVIILCLGAMLGKLLAESGAAQNLASSMMGVFGTKYIQWAMVVTGFVIGIPLYYGIGFVLMVPLIFSIVYQYKMPAIYIGLPMLAALSVTHGFLPPHPSPSALVVQFNANMGITLLYGIAIAIPAIVVAGPLFSRTLKGIEAHPLEVFMPAQSSGSKIPGTASSFFTALLPVLLLMLTAVYPFLYNHRLPFQNIVALVGQPSIVMMLALMYATWSLGMRCGKSIKQVMTIYADAVKDIGMIVLIIGSSGALKQVLTDSGASMQIAGLLQHVNLPPLLLAWLMAAVIRACVGSATVAGLTTAGIILPLMQQTHTDPNLMVLAVGAGSLMFSHVNDAGFWMFKEYFNISVKDTVKSWSVMEALVATMGLAGVLVINQIIK
ncbi:gluconate:H+ symporter [Mucilaginibacter paludis]|uniref:Gluconate transporter n=1 Tax=Mucilaginibacter paludis DSM 18603 TaxID=714943 RepID=H1Y8C6_9SPHI|nr:gluconate:H+ symporter [Mucilaginibacter paludis]EHQ24945.1 gluconate transporter [Mucilaginibacter paludis DSM 18603]